MNIKRITALPLDQTAAKQYAFAIAKEQFEQPARSVKYLGGGSFGYAFGVELADSKKIVVKFLRAEGMLEKEVYDLTLLKPHCSVRLPAVLFSRPADDAIPIDCYGMDRIEGKSALVSLPLLMKSKRKRLEFADSVTTALHEIHMHTNETFGDTLSPNAMTWVDCYRPFAQTVLDKAEELYREEELSEKIITTMRKAFEKFDMIFSERVERACLIHGDLNIGNIMVDKHGNLSGFIDPLNSMYADREYDLFQFDNLTGKRFFLRKIYLEKYGASKYCDAKCAFYGLWNEVYCYIKSGVLINVIMNPLVKNMQKQLKTL